MTNIVVGMWIYKTDLEHIPLWLIACSSVFIPVCLTTKTIDTEKFR